MDLLLNTLIIFSAWKIGQIISLQIKFLNPLKDISSIVIAASILTLLMVFTPLVHF